MLFSDLHLSEPIRRAVESEGYKIATPVQAAAIPLVLEGRDVLGSAQTGTGKTAAFALPILDRLSRHTPQDSHAGHGRKARCLVLCPTRELATQIGDGFRTYGKNLKLKLTTIFGGVGQNPQVAAIRHGVDIIIATPGRLLDLMNQRLVDLSGIEVLVLDEADRMLDMGFIHDIRRITSHLPHNRQTLLFSATMPHEIRHLADSLMKNPAKIALAPTSSPTAERIEQSVYFVEKKNKPELLAHLVKTTSMFRTIVFVRTKRGADRVVRHLHHRGIKSEAIHGNKSQNARERALQNFRSSKIPVLIATDVASRGIDIDDITHVVNYDITNEPETYVHRIGRTARAGASGSAIAFCDNEERGDLRAIEKLIGRSIPVKKDHPNYEARFEAAAKEEAEERAPRHRQERSSGGDRRHADHPRENRPARDSRAQHPATHRSQKHEPRAEGNRPPQHSNRTGGHAHPRQEKRTSHSAPGQGHRAAPSRASQHENRPAAQPQGSHAHSHRSPSAAPKPHAQNRSGLGGPQKPSKHRKGGGRTQAHHPLSRGGQSRH